MECLIFVVVARSDFFHTNTLCTDRGHHFRARKRNVTVHIVTDFEWLQSAGTRILLTAGAFLRSLSEVQTHHKVSGNTVDFLGRIWVRSRFWSCVFIDPDARPDRELKMTALGEDTGI